MGTWSDPAAYRRAAASLAAEFRANFAQYEGRVPAEVAACAAGEPRRGPRRWRMRLLVRGGTVVSPSGRRKADVLCDGEQIAAVLDTGEVVQADDVIDAAGLLVFPGFIDPHIHPRDPGDTHKEDFAHASRAAAVGGVTTLLVMPNAVPPVTDVASFRRRAEEHGAVAHVDFGLWGCRSASPISRSCPRSSPRARSRSNCSGAMHSTRSPSGSSTTQRIARRRT